MNKLLTVSSALALIAFAFCLWGGLAIIGQMAKADGGMFDKENIIWTGIGLYFIGKSVFVGTMVVLTAIGIKSRS